MKLRVAISGPAREAQMKISKLTVTPVATHDQPLLNSTGVHESYRTRTVVQIKTADGYTGVGETSGNALVEVEANRNWIEGYDPRQMTRARLLWSGPPPGMGRCRDRHARLRHPNRPDCPFATTLAAAHGTGSNGRHISSISSLMKTERARLPPAKLLIPKVLCGRRKSLSTNTDSKP